VLHGDPAPPPKRGTTPNFRPMSIVAKRSPISTAAEHLLYLPGCGNVHAWGVHWRHLPNATEPSMCVCDTALCQITLTTCFFYFKIKNNKLLYTEFYSPTNKLIPSVTDQYVRRHFAVMSFRPHRSTSLCTQMHAIVTDGVAWSVGLSIDLSPVTAVGPAKTAKPIRMLFRLRTRGTIY